MSLNLDQLPDDVNELKRLLVARIAELTAAKNGLLVSALQIEKLKIQVARLKREAFGASSERLAREIEQLELRLEEAEAAQAEAAAAISGTVEPSATEDEPQSPETPEAKSRRQLPAELPRMTQQHEPPRVCDCNAVQRKVGEDVTEILEYIPGRFEVVRHVRPATSCWICGAMAQAPMPALPIPRGQAGPGFLAHVLIAKYCDHIPLYRQAEIYARDGIDIDRGRLADWVGRMAWLVKPLADRIAAHVMAGQVIHADDTPVPVLAPGNGKTRTGRIWVYLRDERHHAGAAPPAVLYHYTPDRKGERCHAHLASFRGHLHADGYVGFAELYDVAGMGPPRVVEVACWAHARRKFFDVHKATGSAIAKEALNRIGGLFDIERTIAGQSPDRRAGVRRDKAKPKLNALATWFDEQLKLIPGKSELAGAIRYARSRREALTRYCDDGRLEISNNAAENAIRPVALGRKNWLFAGSDSGGERAAIFYTLIRSAKLNGLEPEAYLRDLLARIGEHPINSLDELLPWKPNRDAAHRCLSQPVSSPRNGSPRRSLTVAAIEPPELLDVLRKVEGRGAHDITKRLREHCGQIFRFAIASGRARRDPSADLRGALKAAPPVQHQKAMSRSELPAFLRQLEAYDGEVTTRLALKLIILTMVRTKELRGAEWREFEDLGGDAPLWRIPASRMKMPREHLVPLPHQAVEILDALRPLTGYSTYLFPSGGKKGGMSENTMLYALYRMGHHSRATVHGFRGVASTVLNENGFHPDWIERQLAHDEANKIRGAYNAAQYLTGRRSMLQWYADYLDALRDGRKVEAFSAG